MNKGEEEEEGGEIPDSSIKVLKKRPSETSPVDWGSDSPFFLLFLTLKDPSGRREGERKKGVSWGLPFQFSFFSSFSFFFFPSDLLFIFCLNKPTLSLLFCFFSLILGNLIISLRKKREREK